MASLSGETIASTYATLIKLDANDATLVAGGSAAIQLKTGDDDTTPIYLNTDRVGIGTAAPDQILHLESAEPMLVLEDSTGHSTGDQCWIHHQKSSAAGTYLSSIKFDRNGADSGRMEFQVNNNGTPEVAMSLGSAGEVTAADIYDTQAGSANVSVASGGRLTRISSSKRLKDNINYEGVDASVLYSMKPCSYIEKVTGTEFIGLIAEDMHEIEPRLVEYREIDGKDEPDAIKYDHISAILIKAIQELSAKVEALENA
jgi:hypothetical protein